MATVKFFVQLPDHYYQHSNNAFFTSGARLVGRTPMRADPEHVGYHVEDHICRWLSLNLQPSDWQFIHCDPTVDPTLKREVVGFRFSNRDHAVLFKLICL